ncbi:MAG: MFS transporter [Peptococcaceae bacterium]|nr:MFS transporter [Peptococcaceae bacterium]
MSHLHQGTPGFRRVNLALFSGGFVTFAILYSTQPLLPEFTRQFHISPTVASLSLSVTTGALALFMVIAGSLSEALGRKSIMSASLVLSSVLGIAAAFSPSFAALLLLRILQGIALAGLPAIAMAYLSEEVDPRSLGLAMGLYVSGNSIGGMSGRIIISQLTDYFSWRTAFGALGLLGLLASLLFWMALPASANFQPRQLQVRQLLASLGHHLRNRALLFLFLTGFMLMGSFVTLYNYVGFMLMAPPYNLSQSLVGWIFLIYLVGTFSSTWLGRLADRHTRRTVIWGSIAIMLSGACLTLLPNLWLKIFGIALFTFGFFGAHSIASSWIGLNATVNKAQASSLYLLFYYTGSSVAGTLGGSLLTQFGWPGVVGMIALFLVIATALIGLMPNAKSATLT